MLSQWTPASLVRTLALDLLVMVLSLTVHECAHAFVAFRLGDDTAQREGRLSLSPVTHIDPLGTLLIPALGILMGGFGFIGWARPTPVEPSRFRKGVPSRRGMALVSAAGPLSNLLLASLSLAMFGLLERRGVGLFQNDGRVTGMGALLAAMFHINVGLAVFNLLPIPPLDGARLLPRSFDRLQAALAPSSFLLLLLVLNIGVLRHLLIEAPIGFAEALLQGLLGTHVIGGSL